MNISNDLSNPPRTLKGNKLGTYVYPLRQDTAKLKSEREDSRADKHDVEIYGNPFYAEKQPGTTSHLQVIL